jgi:hypothetical protein
MRPDESRLFRGQGLEVGWGGWTRTNTVLINSEVSYQLDHAPNLRRHVASLRRATNGKFSADSARREFRV